MRVNSAPPTRAKTAPTKSIQLKPLPKPVNAKDPEDAVTGADVEELPAVDAGVVVEALGNVVDVAPPGADVVLEGVDVDEVVVAEGMVVDVVVVEVVVGGVGVGVGV